MQHNTLPRDEVIIGILKKQNPYHVTIDPYEKVPRPEKVRCSSWVGKSGTRTFGFKHEDAALNFQAQHGGKLTKYREQA